MAEAVAFAGANMLLKAPAGQEEVARTVRLFLSVFSGRSQPPVYLGGEEEVRAIVADYGGVWQRGSGR